jgi:hypothetical protein
VSHQHPVQEGVFTGSGLRAAGWLRRFLEVIKATCSHEVLLLLAPASEDPKPASSSCPSVSPTGTKPIPAPAGSLSQPPSDPLPHPTLAPPPQPGGCATGAPPSPHTQPTLSHALLERKADQKVQAVNFSIHRAIERMY